MKARRIMHTIAYSAETDALYRSVYEPIDIQDLCGARLPIMREEDELEGLVWCHMKARHIGRTLSAETYMPLRSVLRNNLNSILGNAWR